MQHQRNLAVGTQPDPPAGLTGEEVRPAAAVEQHDRLAPGAAQVGERHARLGMKRPVVAAHVEYLDGRERTPIHPLGKAQPGHREHGLGPRRGAAEEQHRARLRRSALGDTARVVTRVPLVLVGALLLLIDDDQAELAHRGEHRRARTHAHPRLAAAKSQPFVVALAAAKRRMQDRDHVAEARLKAPQHLWRQSDLGHQHDRRAAGLERRLHRMQIDLGLARAGDAVQQETVARLRIARQGGRAPTVRHAGERSAAAPWRRRCPAVEPPDDAGAHVS